MHQDTFDLFTKVMADLHTEVRELRKTMHNEHQQLADKVDSLTQRVARLEHEERITRWIFAGIGAGIALLLREVLPKLLAI